MNIEMSQEKTKKPLKYYTAVTRAFREEMERDENVVLIDGSGTASATHTKPIP